MTLSDGSKRRMLLSDADDGGANQIRHFIATTNVAEQEVEEQAFATELVVGTAIGGTAVVAMAVFVVMLWLKNRKTTKSRNGKKTGSGAGPAVHVPDMSPSEVELPTTAGAEVTV